MYSHETFAILLTSTAGQEYRKRFPMKEYRKRFPMNIYSWENVYDILENHQNLAQHVIPHLRYS